MLRGLAVHWNPQQQRHEKTGTWEYVTAGELDIGYRMGSSWTWVGHTVFMLCTSLSCSETICLPVVLRNLHEGGWYHDTPLYVVFRALRHWYCLKIRAHRKSLTIFTPLLYIITSPYFAMHAGQSLLLYADPCTDWSRLHGVCQYCSLVTAWLPILALLIGALTVPAFYVTALSYTNSLNNISSSSFIENMVSFVPSISPRFVIFLRC